jgi:hypothetical protein
MDEVMLEMLRLSRMGYSCAQILLLLGLALRGEENPGLVRAMAGLAYGCGGGEGSCGALTGGCCLIGLYAAKGREEETAAETFPLMVQELSDWFGEQVGCVHGGIRCRDILGDDRAGAVPDNRCGPIVAQTYAKVLALLTAHGMDPAAGG